MPHNRFRYASVLLQSILKHSPIVGVLGQRQTGKTTLTEKIALEYVSLDQADHLLSSKKDPQRFIQNRKTPLTIDECQLAPSLFPALKEHVRKHPKKGQFILTGSVRFTSRKAIRESLTGRIVNLELLPFSIAESYGDPLPGNLFRWMKGQLAFESLPVSSASLQKTRGQFDNFLKTGGLPGICFYRESSIRISRMESHLETLLHRDLALLIRTSATYHQLRRLVELLAMNQGNPTNYSEIARTVGLSPPTIRKLIGAFESMFLIRTVESPSPTSPVIFLEDQGMATYLMNTEGSLHRNLVRGIFSNLVPQFTYRPECAARFGFYATRGGARIDIVVRIQGALCGIIVVPDETPTLAAVASARSFLSSQTGARVVIAHLGNKVEVLSPGIVSVPFPLLIQDRL